MFPPEPSKECVKVSHVIFECRMINHHPIGSMFRLSSIISVELDGDGLPCIKLVFLAEVIL